MKRDPSVAWRPGAGAVDARGKRIAIVGGTGGIGRALARLLAARGASVIVVGQTFRDADVPGIGFVRADLSSMREAQRVAKLLPAESLDLLLLTTGIFAAKEREETAEGLERDLAVSYLSRFAILRGIAPRLGQARAGASAKPRVFVWGYPGTGQGGKPDDLNSERAYESMAAHMNTVAGNEALVLDAAKRYPHLGAYGLNPGLIKTAIRSNMWGGDTFRSRLVEGLIGALTPTADAYAARIAPLLTAPEIEAHSGAMFDRKGRAILPSPQMDAAHVERLMAASEALVGRAVG